MLEDHTFSHVVSWGPQGDCFVVKVCFHLFPFPITITFPEDPLLPLNRYHFNLPRILTPNLTFPSGHE